MPSHPPFAAEPAPLAGTPPSASRCAQMLSGRRTHHRCCEQYVSLQTLRTPICVVIGNHFVRLVLSTDNSLKPARVGVQADDIGAQRLEEACIPRDGGF